MFVRAEGYLEPILKCPRPRYNAGLENCPGGQSLRLNLFAGRAMNVIAASFLAYTAGIVALGVYSAKFSKRTSTDFFLAERGLGAWVAGLSSSASAESGWVTLGLVGISFKTGIGALWIIPGTVLAFLFNWLVLAKRLRRASADRGCLTVTDLLAGTKQDVAATLIRGCSVLILLSMLTAYVAAQLNAAGKTFQATFGWDYVFSVLVGMTIVLIYTVSGGFRAVAWTDVVQATFMITALVALPIVLIVKMGGPLQMLQRLSEIDPSGALTDPWAGKSGLALIGFLSVWLGVPLGNPGQPHVLVRLMAVKDDAAVRRGTVISTIWVFFLFLGAVCLGIAARALYGGLEDSEQTLMIVAQDTSIVPGVIGGMIIAAVLAAICSTVDSQLLVCASSVSHDLFARILGKRPSVRLPVAVDRVAVILIAVIATVIAAGEVRQVFTFVLDYGWAGLGAGFGPAIILAMLWKRTTRWGILAGMIVGVTTAIVWRQFPALHAQVYNLIPAFTLALLATVVVSTVEPVLRIRSRGAADGN
jgi:sodium/proline symporter